jgi:hypothetical protein
MLGWERLDAGPVPGNAALSAHPRAGVSNSQAFLIQLMNATKAQANVQNCAAIKEKSRTAFLLLQNPSK